MRTIRSIVSLLAALACAACFTVQLSPEAQRVRITSNPDVVKGCAFVQSVAGGDHWHGGVLEGKAEENANTRLRNDAAAVGANVVLLNSSTTGWGGSTQRGEAYKCPTA